jgi:pyridinium-3,5-biscarboxylic acid mononucleotide sulfurtransferase
VRKASDSLAAEDGRTKRTPVYHWTPEPGKPSFRPPVAKLPCLTGSALGNLRRIMDIETTAPEDASLVRREADLADWLEAHAPIAIGFSGGVDSAYLAVAARRALGLGGVLAVIGRSASYPEAQWATAREVAKSFDVPVLELDTAELDDPRYAANPSNRCYYCKSELWTKLVPVARARGFSTVADGTNADDLSDWRPGAQAAREQGILSPLAELGFTKLHIRVASRRLGLPTWRQPSSPCLSSRLPYGIAVTPSRLKQVERAEAALRQLGIGGDLRVRYHEDLARVELGSDELTRWLEPERFAQLRDAVVETGFARVALDLRGFRSGSLNVLHGVVA